MSNKPAKEAKSVMPIFRAGLSVSTRTFIVDQNNVAWWIDPANFGLHRAGQIVCNGEVEG